MPRRLLLVLWISLAWVTPAAIAGALGWKGVWGSGSAFVDLILPLPITGGMLHVITLGAVTVVLATQPWSWRIGGYARTLLLAGAMAGLALLLDVGELVLAITGDTRLILHWQDNPLGLCLLGDCVLAQFFLGAFGGRSPSSAGEWAAALVLGIAAPLGLAVTVAKPEPRPTIAFFQTGSRPGPGRGDREHFVHARMKVGSASFRSTAAAFADKLDPRYDATDEDVAIYFYDSADAAHSQRPETVRATLCLYEDGKPPAWHAGAGDCFKGHDTFSERLYAAYYGVPPGTPSQARHYLAGVRACEGHRPIALPEERKDENLSSRTCSGLAKLREEVLAQNPGNAAVARALGAAR